MFTLTRCGLVTPYMVTCNWVNIGSDNGLLYVGIKPLPEPLFTYHQLVRSSDNRLKAVWQEIPQQPIAEFSFVAEITFLKYHSNLTGDNDIGKNNPSKIIWPYEMYDYMLDNTLHSTERNTICWEIAVKLWLSGNINYPLFYKIQCL